MPLAVPFPQCEALARRAQDHFTLLAAGGFILLVLWSGLTQLDKVTRGGGRIVPQTQNQVVQHLEGGIVQQILVREGERVQKGDTLLAIENSFSQAELAQAQLEIDARRVKIARLEAERSRAPAITFDPALERSVPAIAARERDMFDTRRANQDAQLAILESQHKQKSLELAELQSRWGSVRRERDLLAERNANLKRLVAAGAVSRNDMIDAERALAQADTKLSDLLHDIPRAEAALHESTRRQAEQESRFKAEAEKDLNDTQLSVSKLREQTAAMKDRNQRSAVLAPLSGIVNKLHVSTVGGVVKSGDPLVEIVPADSAIAVEARLSPSDRAQVWPGLPAVVKITAYDYSIYGGLKGKVVDISPDALQDERGMPYFRVRLEANAGDFGPQRPVVPGMVADVDILTGRQSVLSYILKPLHRVTEKAFRE